MFSEEIGGDEHGQPGNKAVDGTAGKTLKVIFHQDDRLARVEEQTATESLLMNVHRMAIFVHLCRNPCDHTRSIARSLGDGLSSVNWNLGRLSESGYIQATAINGRKLYWPAGMVDEIDVQAVSMLRNQRTVAVLRLIHRAGCALRERDLVSALGTGQQAMNFHLGKLVSAGVLERESKGSVPLYSLAPGFIERVSHYDARSRQFSRALLALIKKDGLMPKRPRMAGTRMSVEVALPAGRRRISLECNPFAPARRFLGPQL